MLDGSPPNRKPTSKNEKVFFWMMLLIVFGLISAELLVTFSPKKLSPIFFFLSWPILLVIHEFGHALMARVLGWSVELVSIGMGRVRAKRVIFGMPVEFRTIPLSGFAQTRAGDLIQPRLKNFLIYAAGPGIEIVLVLLIGIVVGFDTLTTSTTSIGMIALQAFCVAALFGAITNLIPFPVAVGGRYVWNDGLGMIMSWRLPDSYFAEQMR